MFCSTGISSPSVTDLTLQVRWSWHQSKEQEMEEEEEELDTIKGGRWAKKNLTLESTLLHQKGKPAIGTLHLISNIKISKQDIDFTELILSHIMYLSRISIYQSIHTCSLCICTSSALAAALCTSSFKIGQLSLDCRPVNISFSLKPWIFIHSYAHQAPAPAPETFDDFCQRNLILISRASPFCGV